MVNHCKTDQSNAAPNAAAKNISLVLDASGSMCKADADTIKTVASIADDCLADVEQDKREFTVTFFGTKVNEATRVILKEGETAASHLPATWPHNMGSTALYRAIYREVERGLEWIKRQTDSFNYTIIIATDGENNQEYPADYIDKIREFKKADGHIIVVGPAYSDDDLNKAVCEGLADSCHSYNPSSVFSSDSINSARPAAIYAAGTYSRPN